MSRGTNSESRGDRAVAVATRRSFGADGKVARFRHYIDTAKHIRAHGKTLPG